MLIQPSDLHLYLHLWRCARCCFFRSYQQLRLPSSDAKPQQRPPKWDLWCCLTSETTSRFCSAWCHHGSYFRSHQARGPSGPASHRVNANPALNPTRQWALSEWAWQKLLREGDQITIHIVSLITSRRRELRLRLPFACFCSMLTVTALADTPFKKFASALRAHA